jgi:hypothetical protein
MQPYFDPIRKTNLKKWKMSSKKQKTKPQQKWPNKKENLDNNKKEDNIKKYKIKDDLEKKMKTTSKQFFVVDPTIKTTTQKKEDNLIKKWKTT